MQLGRFAGAASVAVLSLLIAGPGSAQENALERGRYLVTIMDCGGCHTRGVMMGKPDPDLYLAGSEVGFHLPGQGYFYPPNLTPDPETGLGGWSEDDIVRALRTGERPDGRILAPIMPSHAYAALTDDDAYAIAAFLKSMTPALYEGEPQPAGDGETPPSPYLEVTMP